MTQSHNNQVVTFGCRLNIYESEVMKKLASDAGLTDSIIVNTCAVTTEAERQARQSIRKLRRDNPDAHIIVTGCGAQINPDSFAKMPEVSRVVGNDDKLKLETYQDSKNAPRLFVNDIMEIKETASHLVSGFDGKARAFVQIQNGCDHRCTFCTIPYGRGNSRSVPCEDIIHQTRVLLDSGYAEIVLTGVDITAYGLDLPGQPTLGQMLRRLLSQVPKLQRLRLSSLDPVEMDEDLWGLIGGDHRILPHLHLSLQAGDDMVLKRMKRRHLRHDALEFCHRAKRLRPDVAIGADIIAGFPTETDDMFENTRQFVSDADLTFLHVFPYSSRPGTPAARMPQVPKDIVKTRAKILRDEGQAAQNRFFNGLKNTHQNVLIESIENGMILGKTDHFAPVMIATDAIPDIANVERVHITNFNEKQLLGALAS